MAIQWRIGCSGFSYKEWREAFYPKGLPQRLWFEYYAQQFDTLELNVTFYRFPSLGMLKGFYSKAPEGFAFSAKVPRLITHYKSFNGTEQMAADFYAILKAGLAEKLGCVLFQLPPQFTYSEERLAQVIGHTNPSFQNVIEFRHESWWRDDVKERLADQNISFCGVSFPGIVHEEAVVNGPVAYYRFHGVPKLFHSSYDDTFLSGIVAQLKQDNEVREAYLYFNNTASMAALQNARFVQGLVS